MHSELMDWEKSTTTPIHAGRFANGKGFERKGK
jgi:hypothetical protein